jgi:hypothetical protein
MRRSFHERSATALQNILGDLPVETQTKILSLGGSYFCVVPYFFLVLVYNPEMTFTYYLMLLHKTKRLTTYGFED